MKDVNKKTIPFYLRLNGIFVSYMPQPVDRINFSIETPLKLAYFGVRSSA